MTVKILDSPAFEALITTVDAEALSVLVEQARAANTSQSAEEQLSANLALAVGGMAVCDLVKRDIITSRSLNPDLLPPKFGNNTDSAYRISPPGEYTPSEVLHGLASGRLSVSLNPKTGRGR